MLTKSISLKDGWNPNFDRSKETKVIATRNFYTIKPGDVFVYEGGCDHPHYGWAIFLKDSGLDIPGYVFEEYFEEIIG